jgi:hypothetical protein
MYESSTHRDIPRNQGRNVLRMHSERGTFGTSQGTRRYAWLRSASGSGAARLLRSDCDLQRLVGGVVQFETEFGDRDRYDRGAYLDLSDV